MKNENGNLEALKDKGCTDGNCIIFHPPGMVTNGGCNCLYRNDVNSLLVIKSLAHEYRKEVIKLRKDIMKNENGNLEALKDKGCTDGNCVIFRPPGMHTNGGCKCLYRDDVNSLLVIKSLAHEYRKEVIKLRKELLNK